VPDVVLVPSESIFQRDGHPIVYRLEGGEFAEQRIQVARRGKESTIVTSASLPASVSPAASRRQKW
jgi:hypothetical protein